MRIEPRRQIFDIWRSVISTCLRDDGTWIWGGRDGSNSISDAEQLLCLLYPAIEIESLTLDRPDAMADDTRKILRPLGDATRIPGEIIRILGEYVDRYTDDAQRPIFTGGGYLRLANGGPGDDTPREMAPEQRELDVLDAYSMSVTLCLAALGFISFYRNHLGEKRWRDQPRIAEIRDAVSHRLTAALVGLQRSFVVHWYDPYDPKDVAAESILGMVNQTGEPVTRVVERLSGQLARVRARLQDDVRLAGYDAPGQDDAGKLFECGWSWGIAQNAARVEGVKTRLSTVHGVAEVRPYLYFTVVALDGINDLISPRTRLLSLLDDEQRTLAEGLRARWELTQRYWSTLARFGDTGWPLEDIPWRTSDGEESDYFSLLVSAVLVQDLNNRQATDDDLTRSVRIFEELARRGRITQRVMHDDPAVKMHVPGVSLNLIGSEGIGGGPLLHWSVSDFAPLLLKRSLQAARLSANVAARERLLGLAGSIMDHLVRRQLGQGSSDKLWDNPGGAFSRQQDGEPEEPSWYLTERVVEALVAAAQLFGDSPLRSPQVHGHALDLLSEADHLLNQRLLTADVEDQSQSTMEITRIASKLDRAREILDDQPGTAHALAADALRRLDELTVGRISATRSR
jgi:hypothetical protein